MTSLSRAGGQRLIGLQVRNVEPPVVDPASYPCRRPITCTEIPELRALGRAVRALRFVGEQRAVRSTDLGLLAQVPITSLWRIETGVRRTRRSTLQRLAKAAARLNPAAGTQREIFDRLVEVAGSALAPPSKYQYRVDRRRLRRFRRANAITYLRELSGRSSIARER